MAALISAVAVAGLITGCSSNGEENIRFAFNKPEAIPFMTDLVNKYNASQNKVHVTLDTSGVDPTSASFVRGNPPDIALANYNMETSRFVARCALSDLSDTAAAKSIKDGLSVLMDQYGKCAGRTSALPYSIMASAVIYNKEIFAKYDIAVPKTWDELIAACDKLKAAGVDPFYGTFKDAWTIGQGLFDYSAGGEIDSISFFKKMNSEGTKVGPDAPVSFQKDFPKPMDQMLELVSKYFNADAGSRAYNDGNLAFSEGKAAMYLQGPWALGEVAKANPKIQLGTFPLPMTDDPSDLKVRVNVDLAAWIPEASSHKEAARAFLAYLYRPDVIQAYNKSQLGFTPTTDAPALADPRMAGAYTYYDKNQVYQGASVLVPKTIPMFNYVQDLVTSSDKNRVHRVLSTVDADWARLALRQ